MALLHIEFGSYTLDMNQSLYVILPGGFNDSDPVENGNKKFPVLYLLHGYNGNASDWIRYSAIERYAQDHHIAVVMPSAHNSYYTNMANGMNYFDFIAHEVPSYLQTILPLSSDPKYNYIIGLSMGGYGAFKIGMSYPEKYSFIGSLSGALDIEYIVGLNQNDVKRNHQFMSTFKNKSALKHAPHNLFKLVEQLKDYQGKLYINCGTEDFLLQSSKKMHRHLNKMGINHIFELYPGTHNWLYWDQNIQTALNHIKG